MVFFTIMVSYDEPKSAIHCYISDINCAIIKPQKTCYLYRDTRFTSNNYNKM